MGFEVYNFYDVSIERWAEISRDCRDLKKGFVLYYKQEYILLVKRFQDFFIGTLNVVEFHFMRIIFEDKC